MARVLERSHSVQWANPHTDPPDGREHVQLRVVVTYTDRCTPQEIAQKIDELGGLGSGWAHYISFIEEEPRRLSLASKQSLRRKRLKSRLEKKHPLFADQFYEEALAEKPEYYGATRSTEGR